MALLGFLNDDEFVRAVRAARKDDDITSIEQDVAGLLAQLSPGRSAAAAIHEKVREVQLALARPFLSSAAAEALSKHDAIEKALRNLNAAHSKALSGAGVPVAVTEIFQSWLETVVDARAMQRQLELERVLASAAEKPEQPSAPTKEADPARLLSAKELGEALKVTAERIRQREREKELFSIMPVGRKRGRGYPAFQAWPTIAGEPLATVLKILQDAEPANLYAFFTSRNDLLGNLTPVEVMAGALSAQRELEPDVNELLNAARDERRIAVCKAAEAYAALLVS